MSDTIELSGIIVEFYPEGWMERYGGDACGLKCRMMTYLPTGLMGVALEELCSSYRSYGRDTVIPSCLPTRLPLSGKCESFTLRFTTILSSSHQKESRPFTL